jgi:hypothetical protein
MSRLRDWLRVLLPRKVVGMQEIAMNKSRRNFLFASLATSLSGFAYFFNKKNLTGQTNSDLVALNDNADLKGVSTAAVRKSIAAAPKAGINLSGVNYYATEFPFVDLMKSSSGLNLDNSTDTALKTENGYFKSIPSSSAFVTCLVCESPENSTLNQYVKSGQYLFLYDGDPAVLYDGSKTNVAKNSLEFKESNVVSSRANRIVIQCDFLNGLRFNIHSIHPTKPITNIRIIPIEHEATYLTKPWKQEFLDLWSGVQCLRFMDMMNTNGSTQTDWEKRPKLSYVTYGMNEFIPDGKGMPVEMMVDLANRLNVDPWFCIPHLADDNYVKQFAIYLKNNLNANLKAYIEYSNEIWNGGFKQTEYATEQAKRLRLPRADGDKGSGGASEFKAYRSIQIFKIFDAVYAAERQTRVVRVLASQAAWTAMSEAVCGFQKAYQHADVLAIAPYPQFLVSPDGELQENFIKHWSVTQVMEHLNKKALPETITWIKESKKVADRYGLKLVAYEGGQHCVGVAGSENNDDITKLLKQVNAHPDMGILYTKLLKAWQQAGGDLFCHYSSVSKWGKWGCWSLLQSLYEPLGNSPKYQAVAKWANSVGQKMRL